MANDVYCVINNYDEYIKVFDSLDKAKKDIIKQLGLFSAEQIEESIKKESLLNSGTCLTVAFYDEYYYHKIIPTKDMLFYFAGTTYNHRKDIHTKEYVLFSENNFTNFKDSFSFEEWHLIKTQIL